MNKRTIVWMFFGFLMSVAAIGPAQANTLVVDGTIFKQTSGTTFDTWNINIPTGGNFIVDVLAYEASQSNVATAGYITADLNGDGELTWLDADTYFYQNTGLPLVAADALVRGDDINNNTPVYQNGLTALTSPVTLTSLTQSEGATDGSIHFRRDPAYSVTAAPGTYRFLMADFRLDPAEAAGGINTADNFSPPTGFVGGITNHADYRIAFRSDTLHFSLDGNTITVSPVPVPAAVYLFGSGLIGLAGLARCKFSA